MGRRLGELHRTSPLNLCEGGDDCPDYMKSLKTKVQNVESLAGNSGRKTKKRERLCFRGYCRLVRMYLDIERCDNFSVLKFTQIRLHLNEVSNCASHGMDANIDGFQ